LTGAEFGLQRIKQRILNLLNYRRHVQLYINSFPVYNTKYDSVEIYMRSIAICMVFDSANIKEKIKVWK